MEDGSTALAAFFTVEVAVSVVAAEVSMAAAVEGVVEVMAAEEAAVVTVETAGQKQPSPGSAAGPYFDTKAERRRGFPPTSYTF